MDGRPTPARSAAALTLVAALCVLASLASMVALLGLGGTDPGTGEWDPRLTAAVFLAGLAATALLSSAYVRTFRRASQSLIAEDETGPVDRGPLPVLARLLGAELIVAVGVCAVATGPAADAIGDFAGISWDAIGAWDIAKWPVLAALAFIVFTALHRCAFGDSHAPAERGIHAGRLFAMLVWLVAVTGFATYLASFGSVTDTYGAVGSGVVLLVWLTLFSMLHYVSPVRVAGAGSLGPGAALSTAVWLVSCAAVAVCATAVAPLEQTYAALVVGTVCAAGLWTTNLAILFGASLNARGLSGSGLSGSGYSGSGHSGSGHPIPIAAPTGAARDTEELVRVVGLALENDVAHRGLLRPLLATGQVAHMSDFELDLGDWGFTYGIAWAVARAQDPDEPDHSVAARALEAAEEVFRMYCAGGELPPRYARSNGHLNGSAFSDDATAGNGHGPPRVLDSPDGGD